MRIPRQILFYLLITVVFLSGRVLSQTYIFGRADFPVGNAPISIAVGDFNGDGLPDLAVANSNDNTVSVLLGKPNGTFAAQVTYATGKVPVAVVTGDFNGDGNLDLAVTNENCTPSEAGPNCSPTTVSVLLGNGDGTFQPHVDYPVGKLPSSLVAADFNGDGKLDLAVANASDGTVSILLGNGDGTFQPQVVYATAGASGWQSVVVGDFNGDGKLDLAVSCGSVVSVLLGNGDGTFRTHIDSGAGGISLAAGDFNGDGKLDLAVTGGGLLSVLIGNGDGTFVLAEQYLGGSEVAASDLSGKGILDLVISYAGGPNGDTYDSVAVLLGNGDGTFQSAVNYGTSHSPFGFVLADLNGDGKLDLAVADSGCQVVGGPCTNQQVPPGTISVLLGFGDGTFVGTTDYAGVGGALALGGFVTTADFNNDGNLDIASISGGNSVSVLLGNGNGTFQAATSFPAGQLSDSVVAADLRNDGDTDLVVSNLTCQNPPCTPGTVSVLLGNGDGTFQPHVDYAAGLQPLSVAVGDLRGNGTLDLVVADDGAAAVSVLLGNGDGTFQPQVQYSTPSYPQQIAIGDFNGDGKQDLAVVGVNNFSILLGNGDGTFKAQVAYSPGGYSIAAVDFNGDGKLDLAIGGEGTVSILLGNGDGTFRSPVVYQTGTTGVVAPIVVTDFNQDGKLDLAVNTESAETVILLGNGNGTFQDPVQYLTAKFLSNALAAGDFNGDGAPDLVSGDDGAGTVDVMLSAAFKAIAPGSLNFGSQGIGTTSMSQTITISNPSNVNIKLASIGATGNFAQTNDCPADLTVGVSCAVTATFSPTGTGLQSGAINLTDNTRISPLAIPLTGTGVSGPFLTISPARQNFAPQLVGTSSSPAAITLVNTGTAALTISSIGITGLASSDFSQTNNCGSSLSAGANCTVNVTFAPKAAGSRLADLAISDTAPGSPQTATLEGTGTAPNDFAIGPASGQATSQTVSPGENAKFNLSITPSGSFSGTVNLSCKISPAPTLAPTCSMSSSINVTAGTPASFTVTVNTTAGGTGGTLADANIPLTPMPMYSFLLVASGFLWAGVKRPRTARAVLLLILGASLWVGCGGSSSPSQTPPGTPAGTYTATITATSGSLTRMTTVTVVVQ